jgi:hypothetical protein
VLMSSTCATGSSNNMTFGPVLRRSFIARNRD